MNGAFGLPDMYVVYRHLSDYTHAGLPAAGTYAEHLGNGTFRLNPPGQLPGYANPIWIAVSLIQAGHAISPMIVGDPMRKLLNQAAQDIGLGSPEAIYPQRRKKKGPKTKGQPPAQAAPTP
ncbi:hypothetical protein ACFYY8_39580 [Streptosporangium sp. NPDC001559]|uniref:hypothetical protein n=1 Tax=Streptosporangium sp. NPDC001559 TaxID=3366187 RepID=UPI0036E396A6